MTLLDNIKQIRYLKIRNIWCTLFTSLSITIVQQNFSEFFNLKFVWFYLTQLFVSLVFLYIFYSSSWSWVDKIHHIFMNKLIHSGLTITFLRFRTGSSFNVFPWSFFVVFTTIVSRCTRHLLPNTYGVLVAPNLYNIRAITFSIEFCLIPKVFLKRILVKLFQKYICCTSNK